MFLTFSTNVYRKIYFSCEKLVREGEGEKWGMEGGRWPEPPFFFPHIQSPAFCDTNTVVLMQANSWCSCSHLHSFCCQYLWAVIKFHTRSVVYVDQRSNQADKIITLLSWQKNKPNCYQIPNFVCKTRVCISGVRLWLVGLPLKTFGPHPCTRWVPRWPHPLYTLRWKLALGLSSSACWDAQILHNMSSTSGVRCAWLPDRIHCGFQSVWLALNPQLVLVRLKSSRKWSSLLLQQRMGGQYESPTQMTRLWTSWTLLDPAVHGVEETRWSFRQQLMAGTCPCHRCSRLLPHDDMVGHR